MGRHTGGQKGYEFARRLCPLCGRDVAVSWGSDGVTAWLRRHKNQKHGEWCSMREVNTRRIPLVSANPGSGALGWLD